MTFYDKLEGDARKAYEDSIGVIWAEAQRQLSLDEQALVLRDLLASEDMSLATESWAIPIPTTANGYNTWINTTVDDTRFVAIYGFAINAAGHSTTTTAGSVADGAASIDHAGHSLSRVTLLRITRGGKQLRLWQIQPYSGNVGQLDDGGGGAQSSYSFYADDPVTVFQNIPIKIEFFNTGGTAWQGATPVLPLLGKVAEPEGKTINR